LNRVQARYVVGVGFVALGLIFGFYILGPCWTQPDGGGEVCGLWTVGVVNSAGSFLLSWGLMILGIGILALSIVIGRRTHATPAGTPKGTSE